MPKKTRPRKPRKPTLQEQLDALRKEIEDLKSRPAAPAPFPWPLKPEPKKPDWPQPEMPDQWPPNNPWWPDNPWAPYIRD